MRFARFLVTPLIVVGVILLLLVAAAFSPSVQTWLVQRELDRQPGVKATVGSVWAGLSSVEITNLRIEREGLLLVVPELEAKLPVRTALLRHRIRFESLIAKGWSLDLTHTLPPPEPTEENAESDASDPAASAKPQAPAPAAPKPAFQGVLAGLQLPMEVSFDGVELEGDFVFQPPGQKDTARVHAVVIGGGLAPGRSGDFSLDAAGTPANTNPRWQTTAAHGRLAAEMSTKYAISRVEFNGLVSSEDQSLPKDFTITAGVAAPTPDGSETYSLALNRGERRVVAASGRYAAASSRFSGNWTIDVQDAEIPTFLPEYKLPQLAVRGRGEFDANATFSDVRLRGQLNGTAAQWSRLTPALAQFGATTFELAFDAQHDGRVLRLATAKGTVSTTEPILSFATLQAFTLDEKTGVLTPAAPESDCVRGQLSALPVAWLPHLEGVAFEGGNLTGDFSAKATKGGFSARSHGALSARGVSVKRGDALLGRSLDVTLPLTVDFDRAQGWTWRATPLALDNAGHRVATFDTTLRPLPENDQSVSLTGKGTADLDRLAEQPAFAGFRWLRGQTLAGDFTANLGAAADLTATVTLTGHDPKVSVTATIGANIDDYQSVSLRMPMKVVRDGQTSNLAINGTWKAVNHEQRIDLDLSAPRMSVADLRLLGASIPVSTGESLPTLLDATARADTAPAARDVRPFWGELVGRLRFEFIELDTGAHRLHEVAGTLGFSPDAVQLRGGRAAFSPVSETRGKRLSDGEGALEPNSAFNAEGTLSFDAAAAQPYTLKLTGGVDVIDGARLFGKPSPGHPPVVEGRWAIGVTVTSSGASLPELASRRTEELHLTSTAGAYRLLKTNVAASLPDAPTPVTDAVAGVGSAVGAFFGMQRNSVLAENHVSKETDAILAFTYQIAEVPFEKIVIEATRGPDQVITLNQVSIDAKNQRLAGTGQVAYVPGVPVNARPLSLDLQVRVRGSSADRLAIAGLLKNDKDKDGYTLVSPLVHFGGTIDEVDNAQWHTLLVKAALAKPAGTPAAANATGGKR